MSSAVDVSADQVRAAVDYWTRQARTVLGMTSRRLPAPTVRFDLRGRMAGQAILARRRDEADAIRVNVDLLRTHAREMIEVTVPHEVAHVAIHRRHGRGVRPHGPEWKALMAAFGVSAETCHDMPVTPTRQLRRYRYRCGCNEVVWLTSIRHRRAQQGTAYCCRRCKQTLVFEQAPADSQLQR